METDAMVIVGICFAFWIIVRLIFTMDDIQRFQYWDDERVKGNTGKKKPAKSWCD